MHPTTLRTKILIGFVVIGLLPLTVMGVLAVQRSRAVLTERAGRFLEAQAIEAGDKIDRNLFERYGDVQAFAFNPLAQGTPAEVTAAANFFMRTYGIYDLMLVTDADGRVVAANTVDPAGEPLDTGELVGTDVGDEAWFREAVALEPGQTHYEDVAEDEAVSRIAGAPTRTLTFSAPIRDQAGEVVGVWSNRASWDRVVGEILAALRESLRARGVTTVETQILSGDGVVLDDTDAGAIGLDLEDQDLEAARLAVDGGTGFVREDHPRSGTDQLQGYARTDGALGFDGYGWSVLVRQSTAEATAAARTLTWFALGLGLLSALATGVVAAVLARRWTAPVARAATQVDRSSADLGVASARLGAGAEGTASQAQVVSAAGEQVSANVATVATAVEEMNASVREIATNAQEASRVAGSAVGIADATNATVAKLGDSSAEIGKVIEVITSIAEQTNLLALNATIEAARAGEAGKGFAVVAGEVKELAKETSRATEEISGRIAAIQADTGGAVAAIAEIGAIIGRIADIQTTIAAAVEEQTATTDEIARSVNEAARGSAEIAENITSVAQGARATADGAATTRAAAGSLAQVAAQLQALVGGGRGAAPAAAPAPPPAHGAAPGGDPWQAMEQDLAAHGPDRQPVR